MAITMIASNPSIGWKVALRRVLMVVFGRKLWLHLVAKGERMPPFSHWMEQGLVLLGVCDII